MKAVIYEEYGSPDVLKLTEVEKPEPSDNEILVKVHATTVCAADWRMRKADPFLARLFNGLFKPVKINILGMEISGTIEQTGENVNTFKKGDDILASTEFAFGGYAEYVCIPRNAVISLKPANISFLQAAVLPFGGLAALNHLRMGKIRKEQKVLVYGASGSGGTYAVQLAKYFGAEVTAVCSSGNFELVKSIGAERAIDYKKENIFEMNDRYDFIYDAVGKLFTGISKSGFKKILKPGGSIVTVEMSRKDKPEDLAFLAELVSTGKIKPVIDREYPFEQLSEAHRYAEKRHKRGNVVITL